MLGFLNKRVSIVVGIIVVIAVGVFAGWLIIIQCQKLIEVRSQVLYNVISQ
jgi:ABC-type microcin C transport system permease subunit YejE